MFLIILDYLRPLDVVDRHVDAHRSHLARQFAAGHLLVSGPQIPRKGGVILSCLKTRAEVDAMMQRDPFILNGVADYQVTEFVARAAHPQLEAFVEQLPD